MKRYNNEGNNKYVANNTQEEIQLNEIINNK